MCLHCMFAQEVWLLVSNWTDGQVKFPSPGVTVQDWWNNSMHGLQKKDKHHLPLLLIYTTWNVWKERNRHIFDSAVARPTRILALIKEEVKIREVACARGHGPVVSQ